ncbi:MAG: putative endonuclease [Pseudomonadota bacterium]|nr:putative endonuclease [Pseudomonadota bacterium]MDQ1310782.1 putative endonuclease [Pseudomonadota bacterium]MDQ1342365.1 putative endonuclease [Pseudomonadota bacterium]MDQ1345425.1 putative endonuclease [Pseudomonadota bacterium]
MNPENTTTLGRRAEDLARRHLEALGLQLLERNYRCRAGEIDLVMLDGTTLALVEVRSRSTSAHGGAAATVGARKQQRFIRAARHLLLTRPEFRKLAARFDVVAIDAGPDGGPPVVRWIRDAFRMRG